MNKLLYAIGCEFPTADIFGNCQFTSNVYDFAHNYLRMRIGEPIVMRNSVDNLQAKNLLSDLINHIAAVARKTKSTKLADFALHLIKNNDANSEDGTPNYDLEREPDDGGFGMIHVTIALGEQ